MRALEAQLGETERRARQRETDLDRLRVKLAQVAIKEKETAARHRTVLTAWRAGAVPSAIAPSLLAPSITNTNSNSNSNPANCKEINTMVTKPSLDPYLHPNLTLSNPSLAPPNFTLIIPVLP